MLVQDLFESVEYIGHHSSNVGTKEVLINHSKNELRNLLEKYNGELRGLLDEKGNSYWWDGNSYVHNAAASELGLNIRHLSKLFTDPLDGGMIIVESVSSKTPQSAFERLEKLARAVGYDYQKIGHTFDLAEPLKEGRDAPLYHATSVSGVLNILQKGYIVGNKFPGEMGDAYGKHVSTSRDARRRYSNHGYRELSPVQLILDQPKIIQKFKIVPTDYYNSSYRQARRPESWKRHESEEAIITDKLSLDYVKAIEIFADCPHKEEITQAAKERNVPVIEQGIIHEAVTYLPATPENIAKARAFVFKKWVERYDEWYTEVSRYPTTLKRNPPKDLSNSCKFSSMFAQRIFGGKLRGSDIHQYVLLPNRKRLDLNIDAEDVQGFIENGDDPHWHDRKWFGNPYHKESMRSCEPRVNQWVKEFLSEISLQETVLVEGRDAPLYHNTSFTNAISILNHGVIVPGWLGDNANISVSRDPSYHLGRDNCNVQFVLDQTKLAQRYKIKPFDYFHGYLKGSSEFGSIMNRNHEYEEQIFADEILINKYVVAINIYDPRGNTNSNIELQVERIKILADEMNIPVKDNRTVSKIKESKETISLKSRFNHNDMELDVFSNPSPTELSGIYKKYGDLRGLIDEKGNFYWWDGNDAIHNTVAGKIGLSYSACSTIEFVIKDHIHVICKNPKTPAAAFARLERIAERCGLYVEDDVLEESVRRVSVSGYPVVVIENPTREQFAKFAEKHRAIRGLISSDDKNLWIWEAGSAVHTTMMEKLGLNRVDCIAYHDGRWNGPVNDYGDVYRKPLERLTPKPKREYDQKEIEQLLKDLEESASGGATGAASVATAVGGLGAGFDNDYSKSIYGKPKERSKPLVIKRVNETELDEITLIPDFDDKLNADRRENRESNWAVPKTAKKVGRIGEFNLYKDTQYGVDTYYLLDSKKFPMGKANVFQTDARFGGYYKVSHIWFDPTIRRKGYGIKFYEFLLNSGLTLVSDEDQTRYSKSIWLRLAQKYTVRPFDKFSGKLYAPIKDTSEIYGTSELLIATKKPMKESHKIDEINIVGDFDDDILSDDSTYREIMWALPSGAKKVGQIGDLDIFKDSDHYFIVDDAKKTMGKATIAKVVGGYKVSNILFDPSIRGKGYGFKFYEYLLDKGISIISDKNQTRFSQKIWQKLAKKYTVRPFINGRKGDPVDDLSKFYDHSNKTVLLIVSKNLR